MQIIVRLALQIERLLLWEAVYVIQEHFNLIVTPAITAVLLVLEQVLHALVVMEQP